MLAAELCAPAIAQSGPAPTARGQGAAGGLIESLPPDPGDQGGAAPQAHAGSGLNEQEPINCPDFLAGRWFAQGTLIDGRFSRQITFQGDEYKLEVFGGQSNDTVVGNYTLEPSKTDADQQTLTLTPVSWAPKRPCNGFTGACETVPRPRVITTTLSKVDNKTIECIAGAYPGVLLTRPRGF